MNMRLLTFLIVCALGACATASETNSPAQADTETLHAQVPEAWEQAINKHIGNLHVEEFLPPNSPVPWQQKLSYEALSGSGLPDPLTFVQGLAEQQSKLCNDFEDFNIFAGFENGYPSVVRILQCGENHRTHKPILTMIKVIRGNKALYIISRIWRLEKTPPQLADQQAEFPIDQAEVAAWSQILRSITLCDSSLAAHACTPKASPETSSPKAPSPKALSPKA
ncbi:MAG: hypothetical protein GXP16_02690 [Gammaproteobacteria bacterium]|nr:hypothetical protein [Gammaproteobacteria bacterium]